MSAPKGRVSWVLLPAAKMFFAVMTGGLLTSLVLGQFGRARMVPGGFLILMALWLAARAGARRSSEVGAGTVHPVMLIGSTLSVLGSVGYAALRLLRLGEPLFWFEPVIIIAASFGFARSAWRRAGAIEGSDPHPK